MKLIIDVPDKVFKRLVAGEIQYGGFTARNIFNSVKEGIPYEERPQGEFTLNDLKGYLLFYGYSSDAVEDTLINFESYVKGKKGGAE